MLPLPDDVHGLIFDCDGTLADTMPLHLRAWQAMMARFGGSISSEEFYALGGVPTRRMIEILNERHNTNVPVDEGTIEKEKLYFDLTHTVEPIAEVIDVVNHARGRLPMAVASGGERYVVERTLKLIGLDNAFDAVVTADDVQWGKPSPDIFLEASLRIGIPPPNCLVFEDADNGFIAAQHAKMRCIDIRKHRKSTSKSSDEDNPSIISSID